MDRVVRSIFEAMRNYGSMNEGKNALDRLSKAVPEPLFWKYCDEDGYAGKSYADESPENGKSVGQAVVDKTKEAIRNPSVKGADEKFAPGAFRVLLVDCGFMKKERTAEEKERTRSFVELYREMLKDEEVLLDFNFRECVETKSGIKPKQGAFPWTFDDFNKRYGRTVQARKEQEKEDSKNRKSVEDKGYKVVEIKDFDDARKYGEFTGGKNGKSQLCYTENESTMRGQFSGFEENRVWVALKDGYEDVEPDVGNGHPYDEYGLSMIWVFVGGDGSLSFCNIRWNHAAEIQYDTDHALSVPEIEEVTGLNFFETFLPYGPRVEPFCKGYEIEIAYGWKRLLEEDSGKEIFRCEQGEDIFPFDEETFGLSSRKGVNLVPFSDSGKRIFNKDLDYDRLYPINDKYLFAEEIDGHDDEASRYYTVMSYSDPGTSIFDDEVITEVREPEEGSEFVEMYIDRYWTGDSGWALLSKKDPTRLLFFDEGINSLDRLVPGIKLAKKSNGKYNFISEKDGRFTFEHDLDNINPSFFKGYMLVQRDKRFNLLPARKFREEDLVLPEDVYKVFKPLGDGSFLDVQRKEGENSRNVFSAKHGRYLFKNDVYCVLAGTDKYFGIKDNGKFNIVYFDSPFRKAFLKDVESITGFDGDTLRIGVKDGVWTLLSKDGDFKIGFGNYIYAGDIAAFNDKYIRVMDEPLGDKENLVRFSRPNERVLKEDADYITPYDKNTIEIKRGNVVTYARTDEDDGDGTLEETSTI